MKQVVRPIDKVCRSLACLGAGIARILLVVTLLVQGGLLTYLLIAGPLSLPREIRERLDQELIKYGLRLETGSLTFDLTGGLYAGDAKLYTLEGREPLLSADGVFVQIDLLMLAMGKIGISAIRVDRGDLLLPPVLSETGAAQPIVENIYAQLRIGARYCTIDLLHAEHQQLRLFVTGSLRPELFGTPTAMPSRAPLLGQISALWERLQASREILTMFEQPVAHLTVSMPGAEVVTADFSFRATSFTHPDGWRLDNLQATGSELDMTARRFREPLVLATDKAVFPGVQVDGLLARLQLDGEAPHFSLGHAQVTAQSLLIEDTRVHGLAADLTVPAPGELALAGGFLFARQPVEWHAATHEEGVSLTVRSEVDPATVLSIPLVAHRLPPIPLSFGKPPYLRVDVSLTRDFHFQGGFLLADLEDVVAKDVSIGRGIGWGSFDRDWLRLEFFHARGSQMDVVGSLSQSLRDLQHRLSIKGTVLPAHINPWLEDWWDNIWEDLTFHGALPTIDMSMSGRWKQEIHRQVFGRASGTNASYRGMRLEECSFDFAAVPGFASLHDLDARKGDRTATGRLQWINVGYAPKEVAFHIEAQSTLPPSEALRALGPPWDALGEEILVAGVSSSVLDARMVYYPGEDFHRKEAVAQLATPEPSTLWSVPLQSFSMEAERRLTEEEDALHVTRFAGMGFGGRIQANGSIDLSRPDDPELEAALEIRQSSLAELLDMVNELRKEEGAPEDVTESSTREGLLDLDLAVTGPLTDPWGLNGEGSFQLTEGDLAELHLFGVLSRALQVVPFLTFSTLYIDRGEGAFTMKEGVLDFPELTFSGDGTQIIADGRVTLPETALDFNVELHLLKESNSPLLLLSPVFYPFAKVFEVKLGGTLEDPDWRLRLFANES